MKNRMMFAVCLILIALTSKCYALSAKCLQSSERKNACPHLIYKKAALAVASLNVDKGEVICLCLSDLEVEGHKTQSTPKKGGKQINLQIIAKEHQLSEQDILTLIRY